MTDKFRIVISSDEEYEDLCAEVYYEDQFVCILSQEKGFENLEIDIYSPKNRAYWNFQFSEFEKVINLAKEALWKMRKLPEN